MTVRRYKISLRVLANISRGAHQTAVSVCYINTNEMPKHFTLIFFCSPNYWRDLLCNHCNVVLFMCEDIMFARESSPGISLVFT